MATRRSKRVARTAPGLAIVLVGVLAGGAADAEEGAPPARYRFVPVIDVPVMAIAGVVDASWLLGPELAPAYCAPLCRREDLNSLDRLAAGAYRPAWKTVSDVGLATVLFASGATVIADEGLRGSIDDLLLVAESVLVADAIAATSELSVRRPRPFLYSQRAPIAKRTEGTAALSFFSGHTTISFAATTSAFWMLRARHPGSLGPWIALLAGTAAAGFVGASRVLAGDHFPTDVLAGAVVGAGTGTLVPALHRVDAQVETVADVRGNFAGLGVRISPR